MTPMLATIRSAYLLYHVNAINVHPMCIQFDSLWMRIGSGLQRVSYECALSVTFWIRQSWKLRQLIECFIF